MMRREPYGCETEEGGLRFSHDVLAVPHAQIFPCEIWEGRRCNPYYYEHLHELCAG